MLFQFHKYVWFVLLGFRKTSPPIFSPRYLFSVKASKPSVLFAFVFVYQKIDYIANANNNHNHMYYKRIFLLYAITYSLMSKYPSPFFIFLGSFLSPFLYNWPVMITIGNRPKLARTGLVRELCGSVPSALELFQLRYIFDWL